MIWIIAFLGCLVFDLWYVSHRQQDLLLNDRCARAVMKYNVPVVLGLMAYGFLTSFIL